MLVVEKKNAISLKDLTKICQKITSNKIKITSKKNTSEYDIPYYVSDNSRVKKIYKWNNRIKILNIINPNKYKLSKFIKFNFLLQFS